MFVYHQASGALEDAGGAIIAVGYSGAGQFKNMPTAEDLVAKGPIPRGYWRAASLQEHTELHGPYVIVLEPDADTAARVTAYGRDAMSFRVHGDSVHAPGTASEGCVIMPHSARQAFWQSGDMLEVVA